MRERPASRWVLVVLLALGGAAAADEHEQPGKKLFDRSQPRYPCINILAPGCYRLRAWFSNNREYIYPPHYPERWPGCKSMKTRTPEPPVVSSTNESPGASSEPGPTMPGAQDNPPKGGAGGPYMPREGQPLPRSGDSTSPIKP